MRGLKHSLLVLLAAVALTQVTAAQPLAFALFERYLGSLRQQAGIPGLSAVIVQGQRIVWEAGMGSREVEGSLPATPDTPYPIGDLSQTFAAVLLGQCMESGRLDIDEPLRQWSTAIPEANATVHQVLSHASDPSARGGFRYEPARYASLTTVAEQCTGENYRRAIYDDILHRLGMAESVPGRDLADPTIAARFGFESGDATRYAGIVGRMAAPYRVDRSGRATRSDYSVRGLDAATGLISSARDLARYDIALDDRALLNANTLAMFWQNARASSSAVLPTGLGWFVQTYNGERLVWHFNFVRDAYSSLWLKVPGRNLTLILLANSDGLSASFSLTDGDVTASLFARTFLQLFL